MKSPVAFLMALVLVPLLTLSFSQPLESMTRISGTVVYPSGETVPTNWWRAGFILGRSENAQEMVVYREPELWLVDLASGTGKHIVDPGPSLAFHMPVALYRAELKWTKEILGLEVGQELAFMAAQGVKPVKEGGYQHYRFRDDSGVTADLTVSAGVPQKIELSSAKGTLLAIEYDDYRAGLAVDPDLFEQPHDVEFTEAK